MFIKLTDGNARPALVNLNEVKRVCERGDWTAIVFVRRGSSEMYVMESVEEVHDIINAAPIQHGYGALYEKAAIHA